MTTKSASHSSVPQIANGKTPEEDLHVTLIYWLPSDTPFGNLVRIPYAIIERLDQVNLKIREIFNLHKNMCSENFSFPFSKYQMLISEVVLWLSITTDELIMVISLLDEKLATGTYPTEIQIRDMGELLNQKKSITTNLKILLEKHKDDLRSLNDAYNSLKHHLIKFDNALVGSDQPRFISIYNPKNSVEKEIRLIELNVSDLVRIFNGFYGEATQILKSLGSKISSSNQT